MENRKPNRSALRSKMWIREAFLQLLREKEYEKITVTDIVNRAGINRSTFYAHYSDVFALVEEIRDEVLEASAGSMGELRKGFLADPQLYLQTVEKILLENKELYSLLGKTDILRMQVWQIKEYLVNTALDHSDLPQNFAQNKSMRLRARLFVGGIVDLYFDWIEGKSDFTLEDISSEVTRLINESASAVFGLDSP